MWKVKRGYLKIHFTVDIKTKQAVSMYISSEKVGDGRRLANRASESVMGSRGCGVRFKGELQLF
ncbi:MAG: hypothetical protein QW478_03745 [Candidatus Micrarchaeaceae archaeon]